MKICQFCQTVLQFSQRLIICTVLVGYSHLWSFFYTIYSFLFGLVQHGCLANSAFALDTTNSVINRLWCTGFSFLVLQHQDEVLRLVTLVSWLKCQVWYSGKVPVTSRYHQEMTERMLTLNLCSISAQTNKSFVLVFWITYNYQATKLKLHTIFLI